MHELRPRVRPEDLAAIINGLIVFVGPFVLVALSSVIFNSDTNASVTVRPPGTSRFPAMVLMFVHMSLGLLPLATLAAWRTWIHAIRWRERRTAGWQGVAEAGATGFLIALIYLAQGVLTRPTDASPYVIVYGGLGMIVGVVVGLVLQTTALIVLRIGEAVKLGELGSEGAGELGS